MTFCPSLRAAMISSKLQLALIDICPTRNQPADLKGERKLPTPWTIPHCPAPFVRLISPSGWPSFAIAAGEMKIGISVLIPMNSELIEPVVTSRSIRGRK